MKKFLLLTLTIVVACATAMAAPVDAVKAQQKATQFLTSQASPLKNVMPSDVNATLIKTEMGEKATTPVYYIFNTTSTFVIVSGDDRAEDILFVGDAPLNLDRMPENMKAWLDGYKEQLDWLLCNPDAKVEKTSTMMKGASLKAISDVSPMLTCNWDQSAPYYNQCSFTYNNRTYQCVTGCPATSASMVMYYWKYPTTQVGPLASYTATLDISSWQSVNFTYPSLPSTIFDWANMKDNYTGSYTTAEGNAVATLMRYVGQAEKMMYGTAAAGGSGIYTTDTQNIVDMFTGFGYDASTCRVVSKSSYSETNWANLLQTEMAAGRPIVFTATTTSGAGHAFNVDGFRNSDTKYHINWGWSGEGNGYCAMNAFSTGTSSSGVSGGSYTFNQGQQMVIGIQPPTSDPVLNIDASSLSFSSRLGASQTKTIAITGRNITNNVTVTLNDPSNVFTLSIDGVGTLNSSAPSLKSSGTLTIPAASISMTSPVNVNITFSSETESNYTGTLTLSSNGAESKSVTLSARAITTSDDGGTAHDEYLDIQKYYTLDENDWYSGMRYPMAKPYEYTLYSSDKCAWLTMPVYSIYGGAAYDDQTWAGAYWSNMGLFDDEWSATDVFKGSSPYFGSNDVIGLGSSGITASGSTTQFYMIFNVTNCIKAKALIYNIDPATNYETFLEIYDITETDDFTDDNYVDGWISTKTSSTIKLESQEELDPSKVYAIVVGGPRCLIEEIAFCTPLPFPDKPINVTADPGSTTADITWTPGENNDGWNLRYRPYVEPTWATKLWDFPYPDGYEEQLDEGWGIYNAGEGSGWDLTFANTSQTNVCFYSASYDSNGSYTPDAWLFTPEITLGGTLRFKAWNYNNRYLDNLGVFICTNPDFESLNEFVQLGSDFKPAYSSTSNMINGAQTYEFDLSGYEGTGVIAFRHYNCTDKYKLYVGNIEVTYPKEQEGGWIYVNDVESPYTIEGLTPETTYEVQVQGVNDLGTGAWTASTIFTTLPIQSMTLANIESIGKKGETYTISDELVAVYADAAAGILWCKDQGNASIAATTIITDQIDFMRDANLTGNDGQGTRAWDQSNWVALQFPEATSTNTNSFLTAAVGKKIAAGTITGKYIDNRNYTIEVLPNENNEYIITPSGDGGYTMNVYCTANFIESNTNVGENTGFVGTHGNNYFFMNPKVQEVCEITYAMWDGEKFVNPYNTEVPGAFIVDFSRNGQTPTLQVDHIYRFMAVVNRPPRLGGLIGADPSNNIVVMPTNLTGDSNIVTAINTVGMDGNREVVAVEYVNSLGLTSKKPFHGVNIVVTRYSDGSKTTVKKIFK